MGALYAKLRCSVLLPEYFLHLVLETLMTDVNCLSMERNKGKLNAVLLRLPLRTAVVTQPTPPLRPIQKGSWAFY